MRLPVVPIVATTIFMVLVSWASMQSQPECIIPAPDDVVMTIDVICGNLIETDVDWSVRKFTERTTHYFCSDTCLETYLRLTRD